MSLPKHVLWAPKWTENAGQHHSHDSSADTRIGAVRIVYKSGGYDDFAGVRAVDFFTWERSGFDGRFAPAGVQYRPIPSPSRSELAAAETDEYEQEPEIWFHDLDFLGRELGVPSHWLGLEVFGIPADELKRQEAAWRKQRGLEPLDAEKSQRRQEIVKLQYERLGFKPQ